MISSSPSSSSHPSDKSRAKKFWSSVRQEDNEPVYTDASPETDLRAYLWGMRIKATNTRVDILELLSKEKDPLTVKAIVQRSDGVHTTATVYRTLETLAKAGLISRVDLGHDHTHYEIAIGRKHHHHAVCTSCGDIEDVTGCASETLEDMSAGLKKFRHIRSHSLELFGLCRKCENVERHKN